MSRFEKPAQFDNAYPHVGPARSTLKTVLLLAATPLVTSLLSSLSRFRYESELLALALLGGAFYGVVVVALFGRRWLLLMRRTEAVPLTGDKTASIPAVEPDRT